MSNKLQLSKKIFINGKIITKTGMHIGGSSLGLQIGGADKVVVRNPVTNLPYIPGSSLKGKMRSLLEKSLGLIKPESKKTEKGMEWTGKLCTDPKQDVVQLFGCPADEAPQGELADLAPTRLTVRDAPLLNEGTLAAAENTDMYCTEIKTEVSIDRLTSAANPRNFERVPAGAEFGLSLVLDIYNLDEEKKKENGKESRAEIFIDLIRQGLTLVEDDYIGGQGSRGYGQVEFVVESVTERSAKDYRDGSGAGKSGAEGKFSAFMNR